MATTIGGGVPEGAGWPRRLLDAMGEAIGQVRPAVLRGETAAVLDEYLRFRHLFRSHDGFELVWERIVPLLAGLEGVHAALDEDLVGFQSFLGSVAG
ncbi:MAG: hypothetical protein IT385_21645 [Deltaproteobacteria bacterium]|nr:hypothetical protein [Deltaproteobacteria bacterium]